VLTPLVRAVFWKHRRRYGARRIARELADLGEVCSPRRVGKILKKQGLLAIQPKSFVPKTTDSRHHLGYSPNLILDTPEPSGVDRLWVGDITYVPLCGGAFCYLATLMDRYSRDIVGWELAETMTDGLTLAALRITGF
jgi:transposase InsO family protein